MHSLAGDANTLWAWGANSNGQLGNGTTTAATSPSTVVGLEPGDAAPAIQSTYTYDGDGLRASKTTAAGTGQFTWDIASPLPLLLTDGNASYIYGPDNLPVAHITHDGTVRYYHHDQLGSTRLLTDQTGTVLGTTTYNAHGTVTDSTGEQPVLGYAGEYTDTETGLVYLRARYYDPTTGQFLTRDPLESLTREPYAYAGNNPINFTDPTGLCWGPTCIVEDVIDGGADLLGRGYGVVREAAQDTGEFIVRNRGSIATAAALGGCFIPGVGWVGCAAGSAGAFLVRAEQRFSDGSETALRDTALDGALTYLTIGLGGAFSVFDDIGRVAYSSRFITGGYDAVGLAMWDEERTALAKLPGC